MIAVLCGGVGAARFLRGLLAVRPADEVTAIVNVGDDFVLHGLYICPDLDTVTYTLSGVVDPDTGWGRAAESWRVLEELGRLGGETWFALGDLDVALHLYRTERLRQGATLSQVAAELAGRFGLGLRLLPVSDDPIRTRVVVETDAPPDADSSPGTRRREEIDFQDYFVARRHAVPVSSVRYAGADTARPAPGVLEALHSAQTIVIAPSNPFVSIAPVLAVAGVREALSADRAKVVAISPIVGGTALKGPAGQMMTELGHTSGVVGVAELHASVAATLVIDEADRQLAAAVDAAGIIAAVTDTIMADDARSAALASFALDAAVSAAGSTAASSRDSAP